MLQKQHLRNGDWFTITLQYEHVHGHITLQTVNTAAQKK